uniref:NADH-ubiquinone oxidoreductase chain 4L n=1 Tax=Colobopsis nipponica TaxID=2681982 RepID=A0A7S6XWB9_9HYME|nr:NADH dehydrogenase subunit 4L [Colobopsis nipponica]QOW83448.1 NADH dehydrogenase subunit 4L [Colobopsis nipponica]
MIDFMIYVYSCLFIFLSLIYMYKFMLVVLMIIELIVIGLSMMIYLIYNYMNLELFMIYYLVFMVCEATLGLALLVLIIRFHGNEYYYSLNLMKF